MLDIHMFSTATKVKGQGVGSAYMELVQLLQRHFQNEFKVSINQYGRSDISHYHTINFRFFSQLFSGAEAVKLVMFIFCRKR